MATITATPKGLIITKLVKLKQLFQNPNRWTHGQLKTENSPAGLSKEGKPVTDSYCLLGGVMHVFDPKDTWDSTQAYGEFSGPIDPIRLAMLVALADACDPRWRVNLERRLGYTTDKQRHPAITYREAVRCVYGWNDNVRAGGRAANAAVVRDKIESVICSLAETPNAG